MDGLYSAHTGVRSRWRVIATLAALATTLAGCGFQPLHGKSSPASAAALGGIEIAIIADRTGQKLRNLLLDKLNPHGPSDRPRYVLRVTVAQSIHSLAIRKDEIATRANLVLRADYELRRKSDRKLVTKGSASSTNSYNILRSNFATLSAENDARNRAVRVLSEDLRTRIGIYLSRPGKSAGGDPR